MKIYKKDCDSFKGGYCTLKRKECKGFCKHFWHDTLTKLQLSSELSLKELQQTEPYATLKRKSLEIQGRFPEKEYFTEEEKDNSLMRFIK